MEYKSFFSKFTLQMQRKMGYRGQYKRKSLISAMKRMMKDHESITKNYENLFCSIKGQCKNSFALNLRSYIPILQYWRRVSCGLKLRHLNFLKKSPTFRILFRKSHAFTSALKLGFHLALTRVNSNYFF